MSVPRTVCFLTGTLDALAGAERVTAVLANALADRGWRVHILCLWGTRSQFDLNQDVHTHTLFAARPSFRTHYVATVRGIREYVRTHAIEILVGVDTMLAWFTLPACLGLNVKQVAWEHASFDQDLGRRARRSARRIAAKRFACVVVLTETDRQQWLDAIGRQAPITCIANPLPFHPMEVSSTTLPKTGPGKVLAVGRLVHAKGFDILLHAWQLALPSVPGWHLEIVGDGECGDALRQLCNSLGISAHVTLSPATREIEDHYRQASLFCLSSRHEGFGMVMVEAMAFGLPVIATDCPVGPRALLRHDENAMVVPVDDARRLANGLVTMIRDPGLRERLARRGMETARVYDPDAIAARWEHLFVQITNRPLAGNRP